MNARADSMRHHVRLRAAIQIIVAGMAAVVIAAWWAGAV